MSKLVSVGRRTTRPAGRFVLLRGAGGPLVAGEIHPDAITHREVLDALPERVDHTRTVLVGSYLRKRRRCTVAGARRTSRWG